MRSEANMTAVKESVEAVYRYICSKTGNDDRHQAFVLTSEKEESYPSVLYVYAQVTENSARVIVEWNGSCGIDYPYEFTTSNSIFFTRNQSLIIKSEDRFGRSISVSINSTNQ